MFYPGKNFNFHDFNDKPMKGRKIISPRPKVRIPTTTAANKRTASPKIFSATSGNSHAALFCFPMKTIFFAKKKK